jgi:hypothetical protein
MPVLLRPTWPRKTAVSRVVKPIVPLNQGVKLAMIAPRDPIHANRLATARERIVAFVRPGKPSRGPGISSILRELATLSKACAGYE